MTFCQYWITGCWWKNIDTNIFVKTYNKTTPFYKEHNSAVLLS